MITLQDANNRFGAVVDAALAGRPQKVSHRGKLAVVVVSAEEYHRLLNEAQARRESFENADECTTTAPIAEMDLPRISSARLVPQAVRYRLAERAVVLRTDRGLSIAAE